MDNNTFDLDKARAIRREGRKHGPVVVVGGKKFTLPIEMPLDVLEIVVELNAKDGSASGDGLAMVGTVLRVVQILLGDDYEAFRAEMESVDDLNYFVLGEPSRNEPGILSLYGITMGEPSASASSPATTPRRSKRTSSTTTG